MLFLVGDSMGESQEIDLWEDYTKEAGGQAEVTFKFFFPLVSLGEASGPSSPI